MKISTDKIEKIASLSKLTLSDEEREKFTQDLDGIIGYIEKLNEVSTDTIEPMSHSILVDNVFRENFAKQEVIEHVLEQAKEKEETSFKVPKIIAT